MHKQPISGVSRDRAEEIGLAALVFLTEDAERLGRFLAETGTSAGDLAGMAGTAAGQAAVLEHMLGDESLLMVFAATAGIDPGELAPAHDALTGGADARRFASENYTSGHSGGRTVGKRPSKRWPGPGA